METSVSVLDYVLEVFTSIGNWFSGAVNSLIPMFYDENGLTFLGVLSVASLGVAIILMIVRVIGDFLGFRR